MARRSRRVKKYARRRRSMGAVGGKNFVMEALGLVAGAAAARVITSSEKILPQVNSTIKSAGVIAIGAFFPKLLKGDLGKSIGSGMIAAGGLGLLQASNVLSGIGLTDEMSIPVEVMAGDDVSVMAGYSEDNLSVIAGYEESDY